MNSYKRIKYFVIFSLVFYFVAGILTEVVLPNRQKNFLPFYSWFLFHKVPSETNRIAYGVLILEVNGKVLRKPLLFEEALGIVEEPKSPKATELISSFARSLERKRTKESERYRSTFEDIYLPNNIRYQVAIIQYDPILRYETGKYKVTKIGEFVKK